MAKQLGSVPSPGRSSHWRLFSMRHSKPKPGADVGFHLPGLVTRSMHSLRAFMCVPSCYQLMACRVILGQCISTMKCSREPARPTCKPWSSETNRLTTSILVPRTAGIWTRAACVHFSNIERPRARRTAPNIDAMIPNAGRI